MIMSATSIPVPNLVQIRPRGGGFWAAFVLPSRVLAFHVLCGRQVSGDDTARISHYQSQQQQQQQQQRVMHMM